MPASPTVPTVRRSSFPALGTAVVALCVLMAVGAATVDASPQSRLDAARDRAAGLAGEVNRQEENLQDAAGRATSADKRKVRVERLLATGQQKAERLSRRSKRVEDRLDAARKRLDRARDALAQRLVAMYKGEIPDATSLILESDGFEDLAYQSAYLERIRQGDERLAERVRGVRNAVSTALREVRSAERAAAEHNRRLSAARDSIEAIQRQARADMAAFSAARNAQAQDLRTLRARIHRLVTQVQAEQQITRAQAVRQVVAEFGGDFVIPEYIVQCESGGNYRARNPSGAGGAYQIIPETWRRYGGEGNPEDASKEEQDRIAAQIWADSGKSAWTCA